MKAGQDINAQFTLVSISAFDRVNTHIPSQPSEPFYCVELRGVNGECFKTFTKLGTKFSYDIENYNPGDSLFLGCKFKETRIDEVFGIQQIVTHCAIGGYADYHAKQERIAKRAKKLMASL
jgi:hypothetical protein